jgi:hypothetical protein
MRLWERAIPLFERIGAVAAAVISLRNSLTTACFLALYCTSKRSEVVD